MELMLYNILSGQRTLRRKENQYDITLIFEHLICEDYPVELSPEEVFVAAIHGKNVSKPRPLNSLVKLIQGSQKSLAIQVGGEIPFNKDYKFDSTRPLLYLNEDHSFVFVYLFCPNVTQGSKEYSKWSLVNIWDKEKAEFGSPIHGVFHKCPHPLFNQTVLIGYFIMNAKTFSIALLHREMNRTE